MNLISLSKLAVGLPSDGIVLDNRTSTGLLQRDFSQSSCIKGDTAQKKSIIMSFLKESTLMHMILVGTYLTLGLFINVVQAVAYCFIRPVNARFYRNLNGYLTYAHWNPVTTLGFWWSGSQCRVWCQDEETARSFGKNHALLLMNHTYEVDFLYCWMLFDMLDVLGSSKAVVKKMLAYVPIIGWNCVFGDQIFLERNWEKDRETLLSKLDTLLKYEDTMILTMFSEGTRFTEAKHQMSLKFAKEHELPILKHHLLPRPKGFVLCAQHFHNKLDYLYDVEIAMPKNQNNPASISTILRGKPIIADMYVRRFAFKDLPTDDEKLKAFLYRLYQEKDDIMEYYLTHNYTFPKGCVRMSISRPPHRATIYLTLLGGFAGSFLYWAVNAFYLAPSFPQMVTVSSIVAILYSSMHYLVGLTQANKASQYGTEKVSSKKDSEKKED
ncbi:1-acyl-sn-glycerol-3-phosphate acyltransferase gamma-like isoform X2 [Varroa destructor]|uniref:Phospholipid/glycerol acyltransferase domain-containing protein n=1 Tax=Varroa destructor TaxID=109461 RepID=A0A7M7JFX8_VARDE|nr:1-acyl-sn-glycerol-3-phosphate acyltransferase gamma-like isoform X2 [Varroa destructor]